MIEIEIEIEIEIVIEIVTCLGLSLRDRERQVERETSSCLRRKGVQRYHDRVMARERETCYVMLLVLRLVLLLDFETDGLVGRNFEIVKIDRRSCSWFLERRNGMEVSRAKPRDY